MSRGLAECDFPAYIGGNFKNLIPTRVVRLSFSLFLPPSRRLLFARRKRDNAGRFQRLACSPKRYSSELHGIISFAARSRLALCSLPPCLAKEHARYFYFQRCFNSATKFLLFSESRQKKLLSSKFKDNKKNLCSIHCFYLYRHFSKLRY